MPSLIISTNSFLLFIPFLIINNLIKFGDWLNSQNISADLLTHPNLVLTKMDPPLALMASLWFYMTPQPPKPAMHDIILGYFELHLMRMI